MPMLRRCSFDACTTLTLGKCCVEHVRARDQAIDTCHRAMPEFGDCLRAAHGCQPMGPNGLVGRVAGQMIESDGNLSALMVVSGLLRRGHLVVPVSEVEWVLPLQRRVLVAADVPARTSPHPSEPDVATSGG